MQLGEVGCGEIGNVAYDVGMQLLTRNPGEPIWDYDGPDAEPIESPIQAGENPQEAELETITLDELLMRLQEDDDLRQLIAQQLGLETTDPHVIIQELINQFNTANQSTTDEAPS